MPAIKVDDDERQDPKHFDEGIIEKKIKDKLSVYKDNR